MKPPFPRSKSHPLATSREKVRRARAVAIRRLGLESLELRVLFAGLSIESDQPRIEVEESLDSDATPICGRHIPAGEISASLPFAPDANTTVASEGAGHDSSTSSPRNSLIQGDSATSENQELIDRCLADWQDPAAADETVDSAKTGNDWEYTPDSELVFHRTPTQGPAIETNDPFYGPPEEWWFDASTNQSSPGFSWSSTDIGAEVTLPLTLPATPPPVPSTESLPASLRGTATVSSELSSHMRVGVGETVSRKLPNSDLPARSRLSETDRYFGQQQPPSLTWSLRSEPSNRSTLNLRLLEMDDLGLAGSSSKVRPVAGPASAEQANGSAQRVALSRSNSRSAGENQAASDLRRLLVRHPVTDGERTILSRSTAARPDASLGALLGVARVTSTDPGDATVFFVSQAASERLGRWQVLRPAVEDGNVGAATLVPVSLDNSMPSAMFDLANIPQSLIEFSASSDRWSLLWAASTFAIVQIVWERRRSSQETPEASPEKPHSTTP